jgi:hypothetical protein
MKSIIALRKRISHLIDRFETEPHFRLYLLAWAVLLILISGSVLTSSNPFRLLVPGLSYAIPALDTRDEIPYFTLSRHDRSMLRLHEKMKKSGDLERDARHLAYIVRSPFPLVQGRSRPSAPAYYFPELDLALRRFWMKNGDLYIDVDTGYLNTLLQRYRSSSGEKREEDLTRIARMYQVCLTLTLFENFSEVKRIIFLEDGQRRESGYFMEEAIDVADAQKAALLEPFDFTKIYVR